MMKKIILFSITLAIALAWASVSNAQTMRLIQWQKSLGGSGKDYGWSIQQTTDGGYIAAGFSNSTDGDVTGNHGGYIYGYDYWIVKLSPDGEMQWEKSLGGSGDDYTFSLQQTKDDGYIVVGASNSSDGDVTGNHGDYDYWVVKLDSTGDIRWEKSYGGSGNDQAEFVEQTTDGGYIVAGYSYSTDGDITNHHGSDTTADFWIVKLDSIGTLQWENSYGGSDNDMPWTIQQTRDGGYVAGGYCNSTNGDVKGNNYGVLEYWIVKLDSIGALQWQKTLGGSGDDNEAQSIRQTPDGGYIIAGYSNSADGDVRGNHGGFDCWIVKLDSLGGMQWQKSLGGSGNDIATFIQLAPDDGYILAGYTNSTDGDVAFNHGGYDYWIVKLDSIGNIQWQQSLGGSKEDELWDIQQTTDGGFILAGYSKSNDDDVNGHHGSDSTVDYWIVKLADPCYLDTVNFGAVEIGACKTDTICFFNMGSAPDTLRAVQFLGTYARNYSLSRVTFRILPRGYGEKIPITFCPSLADSQNAVAALVLGERDTMFVPLYGKGYQAVSVADIFISKSRNPLAQNFPNPFSASTRIAYEVASDTHAKVDVLNALGETIATLTSANRSAGRYTTEFDGSRFPEGVYFLHIISNNGVQTRIMNLIR